MPGNRCRDDRFAPYPAVHTSMLNGVDSVKNSAPKSINVTRSLTPSSYTASVQLTEEGVL
jgi:hypothetical protein